MTTQELEAKEKQELAEREHTRPGRTYVPDVDIRENEDALWLWADMPGVAQKDVEVELHDDVLTIAGRISTQGYEGLSPLYTEYNVGNFQRRFTLPSGEHFDREQVTAKLTNGVLAVKLPKAEKAKPRRIDVAVG
ncbi:MAG: Hsp20/alpha crystallin family protein [bacterium]|nr:Hsp20/alpha crystallin family protein [bacterium]